MLVAGWNGVPTIPCITWYLPAELFVYPILVDLFFYTYHRACHEIDPLWRYHRTHHLTKHPITVLTTYSDFEQETVEMVVIPLVSYLSLKYGLGFPMHFHEWWICQVYVLFSELLGHSGLRIFAVFPGLSSPALSFFDCAMIIEDHDLHHRNGYKRSHSYGKQTRLWDRVFGTTGTRIESQNVDYSQKVNLQLF